MYAKSASLILLIDAASTEGFQFRLPITRRSNNRFQRRTCDGEPDYGPSHALLCTAAGFIIRDKRKKRNVVTPSPIVRHALASAGQILGMQGTHYMSGTGRRVERRSARTIGIIHQVLRIPRLLLEIARYSFKLPN